MRWSRASIRSTRRLDSVIPHGPAHGRGEEEGRVHCDVRPGAASLDDVDEGLAKKVRVRDNVQAGDEAQDGHRGVELVPDRGGGPPLADVRSLHRQGREDVPDALIYGCLSIRKMRSS